MRSFFCDHCHQEFDLEGDFNEEDTVFCPDCQTVIARLLPETPERILSRSRRQAAIKQKQLKQRVRLILWTLIGTAAGIAGIHFKPGSFFMMLAVGLLLGFLAGILTRNLTADRSRYAILSALFWFAVLAGISILFNVFSGSFVFQSVCWNLLIGLLPAWSTACFEKPEK